MRLMVEVHPLNKVTLNSTEWKLRLEGRLISESEEDILKEDSFQESKRFLNYFEKIRVEFNTGREDLYPAVEWVKAKSETGSSFDCFEIARVVTKDQKKKLGETPITVKLTMSLENNPKRYRVSPQLSRVLGGIEEVTRLQVVGALWQYVKSNRLQDSDNRDMINCN
jgi:SWI/SNF-related matrix-associated actin-dependent regulator of chromatin subfamily D